MITINAAKLPDAKAAAWDNIKAERDRRTQTGGYPAAGKWFRSDTFSRTQIISMFAMGASLPADIAWKTMDGTFITLTPAVVAQIFTAAAVQDKNTFACAEAHRLAMESSTSPAGYDFSAGWPAIFGG